MARTSCPRCRSRANSPKAGEITLIGIPDPKEQNGSRKLTEIKARLTDGSTIELRQPVPMAGFSGAAALDAQGQFVGMMETRNTMLASAEPSLPPVRLIGAAAIRDFLDRQHVPVAQTKGGDARAAAVRIICVRKAVGPRRRRIGRPAFLQSEPLTGARLPKARFLILPLRLALLDEGFHAFLLIVGREQRVEDAPLEHHAFRQPRLEGAVDRLLGRQHRRQRHIGDGVGDLHRLVHQARQRHHARHQTGALGLGGVHHAAGEDHVHRLGLADRAGEALRAADAGDDAELDLGLAEFGVVGGDDDVALHGELAAAAEREARDRRHDRLARARGAVPGAGEIAEIGLDEGLVGHLLDVGAGGEGLLVAGDQQAADVLVGLVGVDGLGELGLERDVERVELLRTVEPDDADAAFGLDDDVLVAHGFLPVGAAISGMTDNRTSSGRSARCV